MTIARVIEGRDPATIISCKADAPVRDAVWLLAKYRIGALPVTEGERVVGIFSERDAVRQLESLGPAMLERPLREAMTAPAITVTPQTTVLEALGQMTARRIRHFPVMDADRMVAFVSIGDLVKHRIDHIQSEAEALKAYIQMA